MKKNENWIIDLIKIILLIIVAYIILTTLGIKIG